MNAGQVVDELRRTLTNLSAEPARQLDYLRSLGPVSVDELALEFNEALVLTWIPVRAHALSEAQVNDLKAVDNLLDEISGSAHEELWTEAALEKAEEWTGIRAAAALALEALGGRR